MYSDNQQKVFAIFSAQYPPHVGGVESFTDRLSHALANRGNRVVVITNATDGMEGVSEEDGVSVYRLPCFPLIGGRLPLPKFCKQRSEMLKEIRSMPLDGVLINTRFYPHSFTGMRLSRNQGLTPVLLDHGSAYLTFGNPVLDIFVRCYEHIVTALGKPYKAKYYGISEKSSEWLREFGIKSSGEIPNSIDAREYRASRSQRSFRKELSISDSAFLVVYIGRLIPEKGIMLLLGAASAAKSADRDLQFIIAGSGPLANEVRSAADNVHFVGRLGQSDVAALLCEADCLCLPSRSEGFATCLLEAAACEASIVSTDVGGAREIVPDSTYGTILSSLSEEFLLRTLLDIKRNREDFNLCSRRCFERIARDFSWEKTAEQVEEIFEGLC